jgi:tetratricopeptide (TPR) repeat protein
METFRINSKLKENEKEILIQTANNPSEGTISSSIYIDGVLTELLMLPHPLEENPDRVMSLVKETHGSRKDELEALLAAYRNAISSSDAKLICKLGQALYYKRFFAEAKELLRSAVTLDPEFHSARQALAKVELELGNVKSALQHAEQAAKQCPRYADYRNTMGEVLMINQDYVNAVTEFQDAVKINLYYAEAYFNLGLAVLKCVKANPNEHSAPNLLGRARDALKKAAMIDAEFAVSPFEQGIKALEGAQLNKSLEYFEIVAKRVREKQRSDQAAYFMRFVIMRDSAAEETIESRIKYLEKEITKNPSYVDFHAELAQCYLELSRKNWRKGIEQYRKTLELNPGFGSARRCLEESERQYGELCNSLERIVSRS